MRLKQLRVQLFSLFVLATVWSSVDLFAEYAHAPTQKPAQKFLQLGTDLTSQPIGHYRFCKVYPDECSVKGYDVRMQMDSDRWRELMTINSLFNSKVIEPREDIDNPDHSKEARAVVGFDKKEVWDFFQTTKGDCEDYALTKRRELMKNGWPASSLLLILVRKLDLEAHLVLLARTNDGDFILDNLEPEILPWWNAEYHYLKTQSPTNSGEWVNVLGRTRSYHARH